MSDEGIEIYNKDDAETLHLSCMRLATGPTWLIHRYYPMGIDILHFPAAVEGVEIFADKLKQPVCLAYHSDFLAAQDDQTPTLLQVYIPRGVVGDRDGWLPTYVAYPQRFPSQYEITASTALSGAPENAAHIDFAEGKLGTPISVVKTYAGLLFDRVRTEIYVTGNPGEIISGSEQAGKVRSDLDDSKRNALRFIRKFKGELPESNLG